jgi:hypothetical protein
MVLTDVSEERIASIFRVEGKIIKSASEETVRTGVSRLASGFSYFSFYPEDGGDTLLRNVG